VVRHEALLKDPGLEELASLLVGVSAPQQVAAFRG
jgi:hypothetical protein